MVREKLFQNTRGGISGSQRRCDNPAAGGFHLFPPGDEMGPVRALQENIRQQLRKQLARRFLVEQDHGVHRFERRHHRDTFLLRKNRTARPFQPLHAGICVEAHNQHIGERSGVFEQTDVARMQDVIAPICEGHLLALVLPPGPLFEEFAAVIEASQYL